MPFVCLVLLALLATPASEPAKPVQYPPPVVESLIKKIYQQREHDEEWVRANAQSYLAAVQRKDFAGKTSLTVGSAPDNDVRIEDPLIRPHHLRVTLAGDAFHVTALDDSALFQTENGGQPRDTTVGPSNLGLTRRGDLWGRFNLRLSHQRYPALILSDAFSPRFKDFHGLKHFTVDLNYRFTLPMTPNPKPDTLLIASTRGVPRPALRIGWFDFMIGNRPCRLTAIHMSEPGLDSANVAVFFRDATNGKETCAMGRYLEPQKLGNGGRYLLDFNLASNPACAFSELYNCPIPPRENTLKVAIPAGEKDMRYVATKK